MSTSRQKLVSRVQRGKFRVVYYNIFLMQTQMASFGFVRIAIASCKYPPLN